MFQKMILSTAFVLLASISHSAQSTEFSYQGNLQVAGTAANGNFDFEFALFTAVASGAQVGATLTRTNVAVTNGTFSVSLDFGASFPGTDRFLETRVRQAGSGGAYTTLIPRQKLASSPYAIKSLSAANADLAADSVSLNSQPASFYTNASNISTGTLPAARLGNNVILNQTTQQGGSNFNISGNGTAGGILSGNIINAVSQYNVGGARALFADVGNTFVGLSTGISTTGGSNSFFGTNAGLATTTGTGNSFFGTGAGQDNVIGIDNAFVGVNTGRANTSGNRNTLLGRLAGRFSTTGNDNTFVGFNAGQANGSAEFNTFVGSQAGRSNTGIQNAFFGGEAGFANVGGFGNSFFGRFAGIANTEGDENSFFGRGAGQTNTLGNRNTMIGSGANVGSNNLSDATAIGARAFVTQNNSIVLGSINGVNGGVVDTRVGIGTTAPTAKLTVAGAGAFNAANAARIDLFNSVANAGYLQHVTDQGIWQLVTPTGITRLYVKSSGDVGIGAVSSSSAKLHVDGNVSADGVMFADSYLASDMDAGPASDVVCHAASGTNRRFGNCGSSIRYKENVSPLQSGSNLIDRLRPVTFNWKDTGKFDLGLIAEEVFEVEPLLVTRNDDGEIQGVKYERIGVVLINAVKEQQAQIRTHTKTIRELRDEIDVQRKQLEEQRKTLEVLKAFACSREPDARLCLSWR